MKKVLFMFIFLCSYSFSVESNLKLELSKRLEGIVKTYDREAYVDLEIDFEKQQNDELEEAFENPFILATVKNTEIKNKEIIKNIAATIYSKNQESFFSREFKKSIEKLLAKHTSSISLKFELVSVPEMIKEEKKNVEEKKSMTTFEKSILGLIGLFTFLFLFLSTINLFQRKKRSSTDKNSDAVKEGLEKLGQIIEESSYQASGQIKSLNSLENKTTPFNFELNMGGESFLKSFSLEAINEVFMDCYWSHEDEYASFLWAKLDLVRKSKLIKINKRLGEYANYIVNLTGVDKKYVNHTYYFSPLNLENISNESLTKIVKQYHSIFHLLPELRVNSLDINAILKKKILMKKFSRKDTELEIQGIDWNEYITTENRLFAISKVFTFSSLEEEVQFFQDENIDTTLIKAFPSLGWFKFLDKENTSDILKRFSAKELATAWHGPEEVLGPIEKSMDAQKKELLKSYLTKISSSKKSEVFREIIWLIDEKVNEAQRTKADLRLVS